MFSAKATLIVVVVTLAFAASSAGAKSTSSSHHSSSHSSASHGSSSHSSSAASRKPLPSGTKFAKKTCKTSSCKAKHPGGSYMIPIKPKKGHTA